MKKLKATVPGEFGEDSMDEQILKLLQAYEQTATSMTIRGSFGKAGIYLIVESGALNVNFDEEKLRNNAGFKELGERNISIGELSRRRRFQTFGIINAEFLVS
jgi:hypothetical protein